MLVELVGVNEVPLFLGPNRGGCQDVYRGVHPARMAQGILAEALLVEQPRPGGGYGPRQELNVGLPDRLLGEDRRFRVFGIGSPTVIRFATWHHPLLSDLVDAINGAGGNCWVDADDDWTSFPRGLEWYRWCRVPEDPHKSMLYGRDQLALKGTWFADAVRAARGVVCATDVLASTIRHLSERSVVIPNVIDPAFATPVNRPDTGQIYVGVGCSGFRSHDLELAVPALQAASRLENVRIVLFGRHPGLQTARCRLEQAPGVYTNWGFTYQYEPERPFAHYRQAIGALHIAVVPLFDLPHNRIKSNCKYLEFSAQAVPGVYSRLAPYDYITDGETGLLAGSPEEFTDQLMRLIGDAGLRERIGAAARSDVLRNHTVAARTPEVQATIRQMRAGAEGAMAGGVHVVG